MDELTTRLAAIEARLERVERVAEGTDMALGQIAGQYEAWIEKRRGEIDAVRADLRRLENDLRYDIEQAKRAAESATRRW